MGIRFRFRHQPNSRYLTYRDCVESEREPLSSLSRQGMLTKYCEAAKITLRDYNTLLKAIETYWILWRTGRYLDPNPFSYGEL